MQKDFLSYSQHADDYLGWQLLGKKRDGVVVEVGAFDGKHLSNSLSLEELGWTAVCIEPNPEIFQILKANRPNAKNFNCAVVADESISEIEFYSEELGVLSGCNYDEDDIKSRYENRGLEFKGPQKSIVKARTLNSILAEVAPKDDKIDLISIDVEGFELQVLKGMDLNKYDVGLFVIEANSKEEIDTILNYFKAYPVYANIGTNRQNLFILNRKWVDIEALKNLDFSNYIKAKQQHPIKEEFTIDSVSPKFMKTIEFGRLSGSTSETTNMEDAVLSSEEKNYNPIKPKITHLVNPVQVRPSSDLFKAQPVTFETMKRAKAFAAEHIDVDLVTTQYPEDHIIIPSYFAIAPDLERSVMDVGSFQKERKLPLIKDLLERAVAFSPDADFIVYTNVDIALQPHFYLFIKQQIEAGLEAFVINRRTIPAHFDLHNLAEAYSAIGDKHPGFDCFVIKRELISKFRLGTISIGANWIGRTVFANLLVHCKKKKLFEDEHLTFHIGEDGAWLVSDFSEFDLHNKAQLYQILDELKQDTDDEEALKGLEEIKEFMDNYGSNPTIEKVPYNPSRWTRIKKKVKKVAKIILDKD